MKNIEAQINEIEGIEAEISNEKDIRKEDFCNKKLTTEDGFVVLYGENYKEDKKFYDKLGICKKMHRLYYYKQLENREDENDDKKEKVTFIMFNPSTASFDTTDDTIENCCDIAKKEYKSIEVINIFSERNPKTKSIPNTDNSINKMFIKKLLETKDKDVIIAWGYGKEDKDKYQNEINSVRDLLANKNHRIRIIIPKDIIFEKIKKYGCHPANNAWIAFGGFKNFAEIIEYNNDGKEYKLC